MQIFAGACVFTLAVIVVAYLPGKILLVWLKRKLGLLEDISLSCSLGLLISGLVYWLVAFFRQPHFYILWPAIVIAVIVFLRLRSQMSLLAWWYPAAERNEEGEGKFKRDRAGLALLAVIALGVTMLALLPQYYTNLTMRSDGTMRVHAVPDAFLHLAVANELTHSIPPQAPVFAGHPLSYHYGMDLVIALFANATGLNTPDLLLRFAATLFLVLSMLNVYCFARDWFRSGYFAVLVVFLIFFGEDFSFIPGLLLGRKADWSANFFSVPTVLSLFYTNAMLPALGLLFAGLFCLQRYLRDRAAAWLFLCALLFVALTEVKLFTAAHIMCGLGIGAIVYRLFFKTSDLLKVAALTAALTLPLVLSIFWHNKSGAVFSTTFAPWPYISIAMSALGMGGWFTNVAAFTAIALPLFLAGCLGLRLIGIPAILTTLFWPRREQALRFVLAVFVVLGIVITLTCRIVPIDAENAYNNSVWFFAQSKYVAWIFAAEALQRLYRRFVLRGAPPVLVASGLGALTMGLSVPATIQHFALGMGPYRIYGQVVTKGLHGYSRDVLGMIDYLTKHAQPGDVVLADKDMLGPVLALTRSRVPVGYFSLYLVSRDEFKRRTLAERSFWAAWRSKKVRIEFLNEVHVSYIVVDKRSNSVPAPLPAAISEVFANSECAVFRVKAK
jgi:hypothetical protein